MLLDPDVAQAFPTSESVNEALRLLMQIAQRHKPHNALDTTPQTKKPISRAIATSAVIHTYHSNLNRVHQYE